MKIYTRTGDQGETSLFSGKRVAKDCPRIEALGALDECNSAIGIAIAAIPDEQRFTECREQLLHIQQSLLDVGAMVAIEKEQQTSNDFIQQLETWIDLMDAELPPLTVFILPGGHPASAALHLARSLCRRAERKIITLHKQHPLPLGVLCYLNRLSDYLFVTARMINHLS